MTGGFTHCELALDCGDLDEVGAVRRPHGIDALSRHLDPEAVALPRDLNMEDIAACGIAPAEHTRFRRDEVECPGIGHDTVARAAFRPADHIALMN